MSRAKKTKYYRGICLDETTTATEWGPEPKYQRKKSTADKRMYNSDETGYDILGWVSLKRFVA